MAVKKAGGPAAGDVWFRPNGRGRDFVISKPAETRHVLDRTLGGDVIFVSGRYSRLAYRQTCTLTAWNDWAHGARRRSSAAALAQVVIPDDSRPAVLPKSTRAADPEPEAAEPLAFYAPSVDVPSAEIRRELSRAIVAYLGRLGYRVHASLRRGPHKAPAPFVYVAAKDGRRLWFVTDAGAGEFTVGAVTHGDGEAKVPYLKWGGPVRPEQTAYRLAAAFGAT